MINEQATAEDFTRWEERALSMTNMELAFTIRDCLQAADAIKKIAPSREGYYLDQAYSFQKELSRRWGIQPIEENSI
jgi:hypothetical protein